MARKHRSRLAQKESKRIMRQSMGIFVLTGVAVIALIFWGIPQFINFVGFLGDLNASSAPINQNDTLAPYTPQLSIPYEATSSSRINIGGYAEADSSVKLFNNDEEISEVKTSEEGTFEFEAIRLDSGENNFSVLASDAANNQSERSRGFSVIYDDIDPELSISEPKDGDNFYTFAQQTITVSGKVNESAQIFVNDQVSFADSEGNFSTRFRLEKGDNKLVVRAVDDAGNESFEEVTVKYDE